MSATRIQWEDAFSTVIPQINADGLLVQSFDPKLPLQVRFYNYDARRDFRRCRHAYFELFYLNSGQGLFHLGNQSFPVSAGDLILVNNTHFHNLELPSRRAAAARGMILYFQPEMFRGLSREDAAYLEPFQQQDPNFPFAIPASSGVPSTVAELMHSIAALLPATSPRARLTAKTYLKLILVHLINYYAAYCGQQPSFDQKHRLIARLDPLFRYLDEHYAEPVSLDDAARLVHLSKSHFIHLMKQVTGMSFVAYLNQFRVSKAQALLAETDRSLTEIAHETGFCDQSYFGQVFRKLVHMTPREYRDAIVSQKEIIGSS